MVKSDPNAPRRPLSSYFRFCQANRDRVAQETGLSAFAIAPELSNRWKSLTDAQKDKWSDGARKDMTAWKKQMSVYKLTEDYKNFTQTKKLKKLGKRPTDKNAPKRPSTPYFLFMNEYRGQVKNNNPSYKVTELQKELGKMWKDLSLAKKSMYEEKVKTSREAFDEANRAYKETAAFKVHLDDVSAWLLKKRKVTGLYQRDQDLVKAKRKAAGRKIKAKEIEKKKKEAAKKLNKKKKEALKKKALKIKKKKEKAREIKKVKKAKTLKAKNSKAKALKAKTLKVKTFKTKTLKTKIKESKTFKAKLLKSKKLKAKKLRIKKKTLSKKQSLKKLTQRKK